MLIVARFLSASGSRHQGQPVGREHTEARVREIAAGRVPAEAEEDKCGALLPPRP